MKKPQFLQEQDIIDFKKDTCLFCNKKFEIIGTYHSGISESRGDHGMGGSEYHWSNETYSPREINLNIFSVSFSPEERHRIYFHKNELSQRLTKEIQERAEHLREDLKIKIDLPGTQRTKAIEAIVKDILDDLTPTGYITGSGSKLDQRIEAYFHNLFLGDLELISKDEAYSGKGYDDHIYYKPNGIKAHTKCWPYKKVNEIEERKVAYRKLLENLERNPRFAGYQARLEEFPEVFDTTKKLNVILKVQRFDPFRRY